MTAPFALYQAEVDVLRAAVRGSSWDWARRNLRLVAGPLKGHLWRPDNVPYARAIMGDYDDQRVRELLVMGPSQGTMKTTIAHACVLADEAARPCSIGFGFTTQAQAERIFEQRIVPYLKTVPELRRRIAPHRNAITAYQVILAEGEYLSGMWSGSDSSYSSVSMEKVHISEEDAYDDTSVVGKMAERAAAFSLTGTAKILRESKVRGAIRKRAGEEDVCTSSIYRDAERRAGAWKRWGARCPACGVVQVMEWERVRCLDPETGRPVTDPRRVREENLARYHCRECGYGWNDHSRREALRSGEPVLVSGQGGAVVVAWQIRSWDTMACRLSDVAADRLEADGDPQRLQNWHNNHASEPYRQVVKEVGTDAVWAMVRDDLEHRLVPEGAVALTCGVDVQKRGFWYVVRAWGKSMTSWLVDYGFIPKVRGAPGEVLGVWETWRNVSDFLFGHVYPAADGGPGYPIYRTLVDIGGGDSGRPDDVTQTDETLAWLQGVSAYGSVHGCKGASRSLGGVRVKPSTWGNDPGTKSRYRLFVGTLTGYSIDTHAVKDLIEARLNPESPQAMWLPRGLRKYYVRQLTAERKTRTQTGRVVWESGRRANHLLDCEVYAAAAADPMFTPSIALLGSPVRQIEARSENTEPRGGETRSKKRGSLW